MLQRDQNTIPVHNLQLNIAAGEAYAQLCPGMQEGKGLWTVASFESKINFSRLRSVVWQQ